jgi:hypothetical protein
LADIPRRHFGWRHGLAWAAAERTDMEAIATSPLSTCRDGYRRANPHGKPSLTHRHKSLKYGHFLRPRGFSVYLRFIAPLKLPFKFERP